MVTVLVDQQIFFWNPAYFWRPAVAHCLNLATSFFFGVKIWRLFFKTISEIPSLDSQAFFLSQGCENSSMFFLKKISEIPLLDSPAFFFLSPDCENSSICFFQKSLCWIRQPFFWSPGCEDSPNFILFLISEIPLLDSPAPLFFCRQVAKIRQIFFFKSQKSLCWIRQPFFLSPGCENSPNWF